jgi:penicillin-binding protein 2
VDSFAKRKVIIILIFLLIGIIYIVRLLVLQVIDPTYKRSAANNVLREVIEYPARGLIYDRNGELLVYNQAAYDLLATPREVGKFDTLVLCNMLQVSKEDFIVSLKKAKEYSKIRPSVVVKQVSPESYALMHEKMYRFPGFFFQTRTLRNYKHNIAAHLLGYIREVGPQHIFPGSYYKPGDYIGDTGIEKAYEEKLRGRKGTSFLLVDVHGRVKGSYEKGNSDTLAVKGKDLVATIDYRLQQYAELLMQNKAGSVVAIEPATGEILALVSSPSYTPDMMVGRARMEHYPRLLADTLLPLYNRAIRAQYPPGSTFKMAHALVALQEEIITPYTSFHCANGFHSGNFTQACHHNSSFTLTPSIAQSCNAYYAYTFKSLLESKKYGNAKQAYEIWRGHILSLGFGKKVSYELDDENSGFIPPSEYYQRKVFHNSRWRALPIISLAIGQGEIQTTPIQMANYAALMANRGYYFMPHIVKHIQDGTLADDVKIRKYTTIGLGHFEKIIDGMEGAMGHTMAGTAGMSYIPGIVVCGKTGTAQNPHGADHSTFIAFAPRNDPKIAIAVYVENGQWGSSYAAPIASLLIEKYLNDSIQPGRTWLETNMLNTNLLYPDKPNYKKIYYNGTAE